MRPQLLHAFDAGSAGQIDVHHHHIGWGCEYALDGGFGAAISAGATESVRALNKLLQAFTDTVVVLYYSNIDIHWVIKSARKRITIMTIFFDPKQSPKMVSLR